MLSHEKSTSVVGGFFVAPDVSKPTAWLAWDSNSRSLVRVSARIAEGEDDETIRRENYVSNFTCGSKIPLSQPIIASKMTIFYD